MVLKQEIISERLKEMDTVLEELSLYRAKSPEDLKASLSMRWTVERGLIALANLVFDAADHVLSGHFGVYSDTYEETLEQLRDKGVISQSISRLLLPTTNALGPFPFKRIAQSLQLQICRFLLYRKPRYSRCTPRLGERDFQVH